MKVSKLELKQMIRECLQEELAAHSVLNEETFGASRGGWAQGGALDIYTRPGGSTAGFGKKDFLAGKKTKQVLAKDLKPGMITSTGKIIGVKDIGWPWGDHCMEINYGGIGERGSRVSETPEVSKVYDVLDEEADAAAADMAEGLDMAEGIFDNIFGKKKADDNTPPAADSPQGRAAFKQIVAKLRDDLHWGSYSHLTSFYKYSEANDKIKSLRAADASMSFTIGVLAIRRMWDDETGGRYMGNDVRDIDSEEFANKFVNALRKSNTARELGLHFYLHPAINDFSTPQFRNEIYIVVTQH